MLHKYCCMPWYKSSMKWAIITHTPPPISIPTDQFSASSSSLFVCLFVLFQLILVKLIQLEICSYEAMLRIDNNSILKEEDGSIQQGQDHDLKGAATLFTLTNCNSWSTCIHISSHHRVANIDDLWSWISLFCQWINRFRVLLSIDLAEWWVMVRIRYTLIN